MNCKVLRHREWCRLVSVIVLFLSAQYILAQPGKLFDADKQLSSSFTSQVFLDRDGFLWVATRNGLNRYDGYQFQIIKKEQAEKNGMASNYVNAMIQDDKGLFYMGMYGALQTYDGRMFRDVEVKDLTGKKVQCYMTCFLKRKDGKILAGTSGYGLLSVKDAGHAEQVGGPLKDIHTVHALAEDQHGHVWIVTNNMGLMEYDGKSVRRYFTEEGQKDKVQRICIDKEGNIFVGTSNGGVYQRLTGAPSFVHVGVTGNKHVSALYSLTDGQLMIGYDGEGVSIYHPHSGLMTENPYFAHDVDLTKTKVYSIVEDTNGNVWLGLLQKGVYMQPRKTLTFHYLGYKLGNRNTIGQACVVSTLIDSKGRCWVGTDKDGLYCLDNSQAPLKHFTGGGFPATVMSMTEDEAGRIWVGSYGEGFGYIDANGGSYHKFAQYQNASGFSMAVAGGDLWVATMGQGLLRIDGKTNTIKKEYRMLRQAPDNPQANSIVNDYISKMSVSADGKRIYTATTMGVCCLDIAKESWTTTFGKNCLNYGVACRIVKEYGGWLWIGTNDGLYGYDLKKGELHLYTKEGGLADNGISAIEQDMKGRLWIGTDHGLCCLDPQSGVTQSFFVDNGLQSNEFSDGASSAVDRGGRRVMTFGGVGGITWFHPETIEQKEWNAEVRLVDFFVQGVSISRPRSELNYEICDTTVFAADRFVLAHEDNTFSVRFSTLTYDNPEHISYVYSINGDAYKRLPPGTNEITMSHLPPGTYHFKVKAERNNQTTPEREFTVVVKAPWWRTPWAYLFYALLAAAAVRYFINDRRKKEQTRMRLQEHIHAEEMGEAKLRFFMNISHEIRTPMTLIVTPLMSLMKQDKDPQRQSVYKTMKRNSERILHLINQMMDLRKIDKGMMRMKMQETDLVGFVGEIYSLFEQQAKTRSINLVYDHDAEELPVWIDRQNFDKVVVNILSNAFKFTPTGGNIHIGVTHDDRQASIAISDDGEKIPEDQQEKIFERFYQNPTSSTGDRNTGTGIGLDLTRSLVELHYGSIKVHNLEKGVEFVVTIPLGNAHLKPEEIVENSPEPETEQPAVELMESVPEAVETEVKIPTGRRTTIVVAEDDDEIRQYLESELSQDYDVNVATNGREALTLIYRYRPDLIISDVMMPEMDGHALCAQVKANSATSHIPVILLTAKNREEDKLEGLQTGADAYIVKPFNMDILKHTIINMVRSQKLMQQKYRKTEPLEQQVEQVKMKSPDEKLLERVMAVINKNITNSDLNVDMIAEEVGISRVHLHRKMKELTGNTPHDFVRNIRLKQAANLLANQGMNITEVAYACGFSNAGTFSKIFKNVYGMSPREFMEGH